MDARCTLLDTLDQIARSVPGLSMTRAPGSLPGEGTAELTIGIGCPPEVWSELIENIGESPAVAASLELGPGLAGLALADGSTAILRCEGDLAAVRVAGQIPPDQQAARFWFSLVRLAGTIQAGYSFSAHGCLEVARSCLLDLYRTALAPGAPGAGWQGLESLEGSQALTPLGEWLVCPLEIQAQWRCGVRLAETYERLTLAMFDRLGLPYPWSLRNLAFRTLDRVRPSGRVGAEGGSAAALAALAEHPAPPEEHRQTGPVRFRVKRRGQP